MLDKEDIDQIRTVVKEEITQVEHRLTDKIDNVRTELKTDIKNLREEIGEDFSAHFTTMQDLHMKLEGRVERIENNLELAPESS